MKYAVYQNSRTGGRQKNEDRIGYVQSRTGLLMVVADGMGGHAKGEIASQTVVRVVTEMFQERARPALADVTEFLLDSIYAAHESINQYALEHNLPDVPRTTCVVCVVQNGRAAWAHVGDSRLYHFGRGGFLGRTRDHSVVQQLLDDGLLEEHNAGQHPDRNKLYTSVGGFVLPHIELSPTVILHDGDVLVLCTDGFWSELDVPEMLSALRAYPLQRAVNHMMDFAEYRAGTGGDNLSVVAMRYGDDLLENAPERKASHDKEPPLESGELESLSQVANDIDKAIAEIRQTMGRHQNRNEEKS